MSENEVNRINDIPTDDIILLENETEDKILARALEESLRYSKVSI
jgi:hypothetical protein